MAKRLTGVLNHPFGKWLPLLAVLSGLGLIVYLGSLKVNYPWRWQHLPDYFLQHHAARVEAPSACEIVAITPSAEDFEITLSSPTMPNTHVIVDTIEPTVSVGSLLEPGDLIGTSLTWSVGPLLTGFFNTLWISSLAIALGLLLGILLAIIRDLNIAWTNVLLNAIIGIVRGTPLLVQLFIAYFIIGSLFNINNMAAGLFSLTLFAACFYAEIVRGALAALPVGQREAAFVLGFSRRQSYRYIILPQALRNSIPALVGQSISILKDSSLLSVIAVSDLTKSAREVIAVSFATFEIWTVVAVLYLLSTWAITWLGNRLAKRLACSK